MAISRAMKLFSRSFASLPSTPLRVCVVGSGPAGFYTAEKMLKRHQGAEVDIVDRLPTPYGLVRSGVAPDHPETKIVTNQFSRVAQNERCSFFGNVSLGSSVSLSELRELYHVVVLAYGAESDRVLGIAGEDLAGIHSAREFVWWYNGHPDCKYLAPDLKSTDTAVILGQGNVALDVARILLRPTAELATTDIASHALAALEESSIRKVYLVGRRGPVQAACTTKELREVLGIKDLHINIKEADLVKTPADEEELKNSRIQKRVYELLSKAAVSGPSHRSSDQRELHFVFFRKPDGFLGSDDRSGHVVGVRFEKTILKESLGSGKQVAVGTGQFEDLECRLVLKSIGYRSFPVDGLPFDAHKGIVTNVGGRVLINSSGDHTQLEGVYVCGWLKRGPTGIIATNLYCAEETIMSISEDLEKGVLASAPSLPKPGREGLLQLLDWRNVKVIPFSSWEKIDTEERRLGSLKNKPRDKLTTWEELLNVAIKV
ncbi:hypothetical protein HYC85_008891 [Camellia sinensis]|uniref:NADPH:adrenodoxin oxidoreductase, mitochondrial n=1 Tax=Camellia sinensis TaxID=4442 RepID=A0A7J7HU53_CAMSI|nr:hypothetical protein HYC85_008891 [Camellia sinensis]